MLGKELKNFANRLPDHAVIEIQPADTPSYRTEWVPLRPDHIRGVIMLVTTLQETNNLESIQD